MDAAEIARLREQLENEEIPGLAPHWNLLMRALLDALEQAQKDRDEARKRADAIDEHYKFQGQNNVEARTQRDAAQKDADAARALLEELWALPISSCVDEGDELASLRARIEAVLEQKP